MYEALIAQFRFYKAHQQELAQQYEGKVLVLKDDEVIGVYDDEFVAFQEASKMHPPGTFAVQPCEYPENDTVHRFNSRVSFPSIC